MRVIVLVFVIFGFGVLATNAANYKVCDNTSLIGGELLYLSAEYKKPCWQLLSSRTSKSNPQILKSSKLNDKRGVYQFAFVFADKDGAADYKKRNYDPIFNVQIKEIANEPAVKLTKIDLYREAITTLCRKRLGKRVTGKLSREFSRKYSGLKYNLYHKNSKTRDPGKVLNDFHIWFVNSRNKCVSTDGDTTVDAFVIEDEDFFREPSVAQQLASFIVPGAALAKNKKSESNKYKSISVKIRKGTFRGSYLTGSFFIDNGASFDVIARDLATINRSGKNNKAFHFKVVN